MLAGALAISIAFAIALVVAVTWPVSHSPAAVRAAVRVPDGNNSAPLTAREQAVVYQAGQIAFGNCLRERGFRYWPEPQSAPSLFQLFPYVIDDVAWARTHGFSASQSRASARRAAADPNIRYVTGLSPSRRRALGAAENGDGPRGPGLTVTLPTGLVIGHSTLGCTATTDARLYGSFPAWFRAQNIADSLPSLWQADVVRDPRFVAAVRRWSGCMRGRHEQFASPQAAAAAFTNAARAIRRAIEIRAATAEARCAQSTGLGALARTLNARYQHAVEARYQAVITTFRRLARAALPRARALVWCRRRPCPHSPPLRNHPQ
jgi:hypothetical protein